MDPKIQKQSAVGRNKGGPHDLGDPDDKYLRKLEIDVLIPKKMRALAKSEKCVDEVQMFKDCVTKCNSWSIVYKCREENTKLWECVGKWFHDEGFRERCTIEYLKERSEYRATGIPSKQRVSNSIH